MKAGSGSHFEQSCNAQAAVDQALLIVGERVSTAPNAKRELAPTVAAISPVVAPQVETILVDSGFYSEAAVQAVEQNDDGTATGRTVLAAVAKFSHHKTVADLLPQPEPPAPGPEATPKEQRAHRLQTAAGKTLYRLRKQTVEPVYGLIKEVLGVRRFSLRGHAKVSLEWTLGGVSDKLKRPFTLKDLARRRKSTRREVTPAKVRRPRVEKRIRPDFSRTPNDLCTRAVSARRAGAPKSFF